MFIKIIKNMEVDSDIKEWITAITDQNWDEEDFIEANMWRSVTDSTLNQNKIEHSDWVRIYAGFANWLRL